jgi:hypothetical protein
MYFAAQAGLQSLFAQDCHEHPFGGEIRYRANARVWVVSNSYHQTWSLMFFQSEATPGWGFF